jgi:hypothetical protein
MAQQTAVEWLFYKIAEQELRTELEWKEIYEKAKAMEKEQIMNAFLEGKINHDKDWAIEYYNETYNK